MNFEKPLSDFTEKELLDKINQTQPQYGVLLSYELLRRLAIKNEKSSERFAKASFCLSIVAILVTFGIGAVQIHLSKIQVDQILFEQEKNRRQAFQFCKNNKEINSNASWPDVFGEQIPCDKVLEMLKNEFK